MHAADPPPQGPLYATWDLTQKYYNQAFVVMEYFGYLRRDPDALYLDWIKMLDQTKNPRNMVTGFINSAAANPFR